MIFRRLRQHLTREFTSLEDDTNAFLTREPSFLRLSAYQFGKCKGKSPAVNVLASKVASRLSPYRDWQHGRYNVCRHICIYVYTCILGHDPHPLSENPHQLSRTLNLYPKSKTTAQVILYPTRYYSASGAWHSAQTKLNHRAVYFLKNHLIARSVPSIFCILPLLILLC